MARDIIDDRLIGALHLQGLRQSGFAHLAAEPHGAFQIATLDSLMQGRFDGDVTIGELLAHGRQGLGTVQHLGGELIIIDGEAYVATVDGVVTHVPDSLTTPFAVVSAFEPTHTRHVADLSLSGIQAAIDHEESDRQVIAAFRLDGTFTDLVLRSVPEQTPPYRPLTEVVTEQRQWDLAEATGSLVGFRFPDNTAGVEVPGFHMHFIAEDRSIGGHVVDLSVRTGTLSTDTTSELHVELPDGVDLGQPGHADRAAIRSIEGGS